MVWKKKTYEDIVFTNSYLKFVKISIYTNSKMKIFHFQKTKKEREDE